MKNTNNTIDVAGLMFGSPAQLKFVTRFGTAYRIKDESVAEHSFFVSFFCLIICDWWNARERRSVFNNTQVSTEKTLRRALLHDLEEAVSGDFPRPFKYSTANMCEALEDAGSIAFEKAIKDFVPSEGDILQYSLQTRFRVAWESAKSSDPEGRIVAVADFMSAAQYIVSEIRAGNSHIKKYLNGTMDAHFTFIKLPEFDFLRPIIDQVLIILIKEELWKENV